MKKTSKKPRGSTKPINHVKTVKATLTDDEPTGAPTTKSELMIQDTITLDFKYELSDLGDMVRTKARDVLIGTRAEAQERLNDIRTDYATLEEQLKTKASALGAELDKDPAALTLAEALTSFTGESYTARVQPQSCNTELQQVNVNLEVLRAKDARETKSNGSYYSHSSFTVDKEITIPFSAEMRELVTKLQEVSSKVKKAEGRIQAINQQIADLPNLSDRAKAAILEAKLSNQLTTGGDLVQLLRGVQTRALPALPAPERD